MKPMRTVRGYDFGEVASALQKAIRRGDAKTAGYFAIELFESNFTAYAFRRLLTVSAEDCDGIITQEIKALYDSWTIAHRQRKGAGRIFLAKATILLSRATKSRDADHLTNCIYDRKCIDEAQLDKDLAECRGEQIDIPDYAHDCHTRKGRQAGRTKRDFFLAEDAALSPRGVTMFDDEMRVAFKRP